MKQTNVLIVGASFSGLASAAALQKQGIDYLIIEKESQVGAPWRKHYERLHLHTSKSFSHLPFRKFGKDIPRYPERQQVVAYLEDYQKAFSIDPVFNTRAITVQRAGDRWLTETDNGLYESNYLILATGSYGKPRPLHFPGIGSFPGKVLHSSDYKTGRDFKGQRVLVVGFGNSACEIAVDLCEQGARPCMAVRSPVNVVPRDVLGIPILNLSLLLSRFPPRIADTVTAPLIRWLVGDLTGLGLKKMRYGPLEQIQRDGRIPLLDIGTIGRIRNGDIKIYGDIHGIEGSRIQFSTGEREAFDAIIAGIGYLPGTEIVQVDQQRLIDLQVRTRKQKFFGRDGLYGCGYWISPTGQIHEIASDAKIIAADISEAERLRNKK